MRFPFHVRLLAAGGAAAIVGILGTGSATATVTPPPDGHVAFGVHLDWTADTPASFAARTGVSPAQYGVFVAYPLSPDTQARLSAQVDAIRAVHASLFLTVEPIGGLGTVDRANARAFARQLGQYNATGVRVSVRFGHEMNGSWYAWGQQPAAYRNAFRTVANAVHASAPGSAMVWSPNYGGGYPFTGGAFAAQPGTSNFTALDTNGDGRLGMSDNPYQPYYPGDGYVDWVGLTLYHWGSQYPWGENETPEAGKLVAQITGSYSGAGGNEAALPDFYQYYSVTHAKPLALSETGAFFNTSPPAPGASEYDVKSAWMAQVFDPALAIRMPQLKMVNWFEQRKYESETASVIDWRITADAQSRALLTGYLATPRWANPS